jgi:hypothetical protein
VKLEAARIIAIAIVTVASLIVVDELENDCENILKMPWEGGMFTMRVPLCTTIKGYRFMLFML